MAVVTETLSLRRWTSFLICLISYGQPLPHSHAKPLACQQTSPPQSYPSPPSPIQPSLQLCLQLGRSFLLPSLTCNPLPHDARLPPASLPGLQPSLTFHPGSPPSCAERSHCCGPLEVSRPPPCPSLAPVHGYPQPHNTLSLVRSVLILLYRWRTQRKRVLSQVICL